MKKFLSVILVLSLLMISFFAQAEEKTVYRIGVCNYVDDASLNQIAESLTARVTESAQERGVTVEVEYENCNADSLLLSQIIAGFEADDVDLMVAIATPVAMAMQAATFEAGIPVVFAAVSDPIGAGLVDSLEVPGANLTGTSDYLNTTAVFDLIFALDPDADSIGLLYDLGQDSSLTAIREAKEYLESKGVSYIEATGTNVSEIQMAADSLVQDGVDAVFTPTDNTVMTAQLAIYSLFSEAGIPHFTGADSFALNGAFLGYGVDYANLGRETGDMVIGILLDGNDPAVTAVRTFDNGTACINRETCAALGLSFDETAELFAPYCTRVTGIDTAESF